MTAWKEGTGKASPLIECTKEITRYGSKEKQCQRREMYARSARDNIKRQRKRVAGVQPLLERSAVIEMISKPAGNEGMRKAMLVQPPLKEPSIAGESREI
ncbi:hypothetical protein VTH06DRAFT_2346 [Thermothelomyces fergusii]